MKRIILFLSLCMLILACNNETVRIGCDEIDEDLSIRDELIDLMAYEDYKVDESEVEAELADMIARISSGVDYDEEKSSAVSASVKSAKYSNVTFKMNKVGKHRSVSISNPDSAVSGTKSSGSDFDTLNINEYNIKFSDGTSSYCLTSDDRRFGTILFISDPKVVETRTEDEERDERGVVDEMIDYCIDDTKSILETITAEEINEARKNMDGGLENTKKAYFWDDRNVSEWKFQCYYSAKLKEPVPRAPKFIYSWEGWSGYRGGAFGNFSAVERQGMTAVANIVRFFGNKWDGRDTDEYGYPYSYIVKSSGLEYPPYAIYPRICSSILFTERVGYNSTPAKIAITGTTIAGAMRRHGYTVYHQVKCPEIPFYYIGNGISKNTVLQAIRKYGTPCIGVLSNGSKVNRIVVFDGAKIEYRTYDQWRFWVKKKKTEYRTLLHVNMCEDGSADGWYSGKIGGVKAISELLRHIRVN